MKLDEITEIEFERDFLIIKQYDNQEIILGLKNIGMLREVLNSKIKKFGYIDKALTLNVVGSSLPKVCTGCGSLSIDKLDAKYLACCPDNHYIPLRDYLKKSKYIEKQF